MTKHLARRLRRLELRHAIVEIPKFVVGTTTIDAERRASLTAGERIVWDWVSDMDGFVVARERITCYPADQGLRCTPVTTWTSSYRWKDPEITPENPSFREATVLERRGPAGAHR